MITTSTKEITCLTPRSDIQIQMITTIDNNDDNTSNSSIEHDESEPTKKKRNNIDEFIYDSLDTFGQF